MELKKERYQTYWHVSTLLAAVLKLPMVVVEWTTTVPVCVISSALSCNWILDHRRRKELGSMAARPRTAAAFVRRLAWPSAGPFHWGSSNVISTGISGLSRIC